MSRTPPRFGSRAASLAPTESFLSQRAVALRYTLFRNPPGGPLLNTCPETNSSKHSARFRWIAHGWILLFRERHALTFFLVAIGATALAQTNSSAPKFQV